MGTTLHKQIDIAETNRKSSFIFLLILILAEICIFALVI